VATRDITNTELVFSLGRFTNANKKLAVLVTDSPVQTQCVALIGMVAFVKGTVQTNTGLHPKDLALPG
jgi:hypothetical protein